MTFVWREDIIQFPHPVIFPVIKNEGLRILSAEDIAAMKINAILGRASKKDFWDIHELLQHYKLEEIIAFHQKKYPQQMLLISVPQTLSYFDEANESVDPVCLRGYTWDHIKNSIMKAVRDYLK